jgi:hypothetical protein
MLKWLKLLRNRNSDIPPVGYQTFIICQKHNSPGYHLVAFDKSEYGPVCMSCLCDLVRERTVQNNPDTPRLDASTLE